MGHIIIAVTMCFFFYPGFFHEFAQMWISMVFFLLVTFRIGSKFSWPGCPWPKNISAQFSANKLSGASQNRRRKTSFGRKMSTAMVFNTPGLPVYEVFPGVGMTPTILVTSEPLSDLIQWQFLGKAPAHMPMHQVVHSLQQRLAEKPNWTPQMVSRWHNFFPVSNRKVAICQRTWTKEQTGSPLIRQLHTSCY